MDEEEKDYNVKVFAKTTEKDMLQCIVNYIKKVSPDLLCGWNSHGYDDKYLFVRSKLLGVKGLFDMGILKTPQFHNGNKQQAVFLKDKNITTAQSGSTCSNMLIIHGTTTFDMMKEARKRNSGLSSYTLKNVVNQVLPSYSKVDLPYKTMKAQFGKSFFFHLFFKGLTYKIYIM